MEKEMRNSPVYKILEDVDNSYDFKGSIQEFIDGIFELVNREAPEIFELYMKDIGANVPDCSPAGEPNPPEDDSQLRREFAELKKGGQVPTWMSFEEFNSMTISKEHQEKELYECPVCKLKKDYKGVCDHCSFNGWWQDPYGDVHQNDNDH